MDLLNKAKYKAIHFVGIKGVGMTALAVLAKQMGITVTGSDVAEEFVTEATLKQFDIEYKNGFAGGNIPKQCDLVIYTGAHGGSKNSEVFEAKLRNIPVMPHGRALGMFMEGKRSISVSGSHGKTTTAAMIAFILTSAGLDPSFAVGCGEILNLHTPAREGNGEWFVAEADEYVTDPGVDPTPRFLWQKPEYLMITNIDYDHPDVYPNLKSIQDTFVVFSQKISENGTVILNLDDPASQGVMTQIARPIVTYGTAKDAEFRIDKVTFKQGQTHFEVYARKKKLGSFTLRIPGLHNVHNATAAIAMLTAVGLSVSQIKAGLNQFAGTKRRFEYIALYWDKLLFDDYAHHPAEISATLTAARKWYPKKRIIAIFQPHTYSRTQALQTEFASCFETADEVLITEIYASARETVIPGISGKSLWRAVTKHKKSAYYAPNKRDVLEYISTQTRSNDLIITMGAGDIFTWLPEITKAL